MSLVIPFDEIFNEEGLLAKASHWERAELGQLITILNGFPLKSTLFSNKEGFPVIRIRDLKFNSVQTFYTGDFPKEYIVKNGDLLVGMDGDFICYEWGGGKAVLNQRVCKLIPDEKFLNKRFLFYAINGYLDAIHKVTSSVTVKHLSSLDILKIPFSLPPLDEQRRIVAKLDALLARVTNSKERLEKMPALLKNFRQSLLAAAVSGELTREWREKNKFEATAAKLLKQIQQERVERYQQELKRWKQGKVRKPRTPADLQFTPLVIRSDEYPEAWSITRIADVAECLDSLRQPINKDERTKRLGTIPYYGANGQVGWIDDYLFDEDLVVIVEDETFLGRETPFSYIIRGKSWVNNHAHVLRPLGGISVEYLNICWSYYNFTPLTSGTTGRRKLTQAALVDAQFPIAPLEEQKEIVRKVEELFHFADGIKARYQKAKAWFDKIPQAILAKAFRGELVEQDENDEPASVLLGRIKTLRQAQDGKKQPVRQTPRNKGDKQGDKKQTNKPKPTAKRKKVYEENEGVSLAAEE